MLIFRRVGTYRGRLSSPSPSGHSMARGREKHFRCFPDRSDRFDVCDSYYESVCRQHAWRRASGKHCRRPCSSRGSRHAASNKHSVTRDFRSMKDFLDGATPAYKFRFSVSCPRPDNKENESSQLTTVAAVGVAAMQRYVYGDSTVARTVTLMSNRSVNPANEEFS